MTDLTTLVSGLRALSEYVGLLAVTLCLETLIRFEIRFIGLASQAIEEIDRVNDTACQTMVDTFHMNIEQRSLGDAIRAVCPFLKHVHACENDRGAPGSGHVPWAEVAHALYEIHYDGPVILELFTDKVRSIARAAAIWRSFATSQDALLSEGGKNLRRLLQQSGLEE